MDQTKLSFFQKKHFSHLLQPDSTSLPVLTKCIIEPIEKLLRQYEDARENTSKARSAEDLERVESLGEPLPLKNILGDESTLHEYVLLALNIARVSYKSPVDSLESMKYMFWRVPDSGLRASLDVLWNSILSVAHESEPTSFENVLSLLIDDLSSVTDSDWHDKYLSKHVTDLANSIVVNEKDGNVVAVGGGYRFLRWALLNGMHGAQIVPLMALFGKEETIERLRIARGLASSALSKRELSSDNSTDSAAPGTASPLVEAITLLVGGR